MLIAAVSSGADEIILGVDTEAEGLEAWRLKCGQGPDIPSASSLGDLHPGEQRSRAFGQQLIVANKFNGK